MNIVVFDIETVPDVQAARQFYDLQDVGRITDSEVAQIMFKKAVEQSGQSFVRLPWQKIVAISVVYRRDDQLKIFSLGGVDSDEKELIQRFFDGVDKYSPQLISWNGNGFDLPVLHYRALKNQITAKRYWDTGEFDSGAKWNNYISRYHQRHLDLMDLLASYQPRAYSSLNEMACLLGFPGKMGMDGSQVWENYQAGNIIDIRRYCETDVLNTYLVYLRFQWMRNHLDEDGFQTEIALLKSTLLRSELPHFNAFLEEWETLS